jgi:hypothetical protein
VQGQEASPLLADAQGRRKRCPDRVMDSNGEGQGQRRDAEAAEGSQIATGFLDGVCWGLVDWHYAVAS